MQTVSAFTQDPPAWVRPFLGIQYRQRDCWQLCGHILEAGPPLIGRDPIHLPDFHEDFAHTADETLWARRLAPAVERVVEYATNAWPRVDDPQPFDILLCRVYGRWHVATVVGGGWAINTDWKRGSHAITLRDALLVQRLEGFYRYAG